ncbi:hypothetical protein LTV02_03105 [Nocardia yamanashiensis]|uniref:hypothetical protein n=1 Tax=Nocardia yamanashiensis TaxID=209247 RepID=UPI001E569F45|nr:hypothetical protein [Nocardia yamanashiensis]UGT42424.1 hypothetical protein LTV02_03105 [Nocardia yamanashiensis]
MSALFPATEAVVVVLAVGTSAFGFRLARRHRTAGYCTAAGAFVWLLAEGVHWVQGVVIAPRVAGEEHGFLRVLVTMLGEAVYFGLGGLGILLLFFAAVADRPARDDERPEPTALAQRLIGAAWRYYSSQRGRHAR